MGLREFPSHQFRRAEAYGDDRLCWFMAGVFEERHPAFDDFPHGHGDNPGAVGGGPVEVPGDHRDPADALFPVQRKVLCLTGIRKVPTESSKRPQANSSANPSGLASLLSTPSRVASS